MSIELWALKFPFRSSGGKREMASVTSLNIALLWRSNLFVAEVYKHLDPLEPEFLFRSPRISWTIWICLERCIAKFGSMGAGPAGECAEYGTTNET